MNTKKIIGWILVVLSLASAYMDYGCKNCLGCTSPFWSCYIIFTVLFLVFFIYGIILIKSKTNKKANKK
jgi:hypothetical protein